MLTTHMSHGSVLGLNALLVESPLSLTEQYSSETQSIICQGVTHKDVSGVLSPESLTSLANIG